MKHRNTTAHRPRMTLLCSCLASALAWGASAHAALETTRQSTPPLPADTPFAATHVKPQLSSADLDQLAKAVVAAQRTPPAVPASSIVVTNCNDDGPGSLRQAIDDAQTGDTIDLSTLNCSKITLTTGAIGIGLNDLTLQGPGTLALEVSGNDASRVFWHTGTGTLRVYDMRVTHGMKYLDNNSLGNAAGACIFSAGTLVMDHTWTKYCDTGSNKTNAVVHGGAVYAATAATIINGVISHSSAHSSVHLAVGGGIYTPGKLTLVNSTVSSNEASGTVSSGGGVQVGRASGSIGDGTSIKYSSITNNTSGTFGGGAYVTGNAQVSHSTISGNHASRTAGIYFVNGGNSPVSIISSTISGNSSTNPTGAAGIGLWNRDAKIFDSTIAFNTVNAAGDGSTKYGAGVRVGTSNTVQLQNTIIAKNMRNFGGASKADDIGGMGTLTGANNLVTWASSMNLPSGTLFIDPKLQALADNGGLTLTHMPRFDSPVIDAGNNASTATNDQRGDGYPRIVGDAPDIGAVEFGITDAIFIDGFDP